MPILRLANFFFQQVIPLKVILIPTGRGQHLAESVLTSHVAIVTCNSPTITLCGFTNPIQLVFSLLLTAEHISHLCHVIVILFEKDINVHERPSLLVVCLRRGLMWKVYTKEKACQHISELTG